MKKKRWKVPCIWEMMGYLEVEAETPKEAWEMAEKESKICGLPEGDYIDDSFELDYEGDPIEIITHEGERNKKRKRRKKSKKEG